ncbi:MAG: hypothetical protein H0V46_02475 [Sphingomonas sp.]|nr:hypothetical protein [Sphingomonas sp.]
MTDESARGSARSILLLLFFALYFYRLGAANVEALLNYPFWLDMGPMMSNADFIQLRTDQVWKIVPIMVAPIGLLVLVTGALALAGAPPVPRWVFIGALVLQLVAVVSTLTIQLPIQMQLDTSGYDAAALKRLISTDLLFRKLPSVIEAVFVGLGLWRVIQAARSAPQSTGS